MKVPNPNHKATRELPSIPILDMRKLRCEEAKQFSKVMAVVWNRLDVDQSRLALESTQLGHSGTVALL